MTLGPGELSKYQRRQRARRTAHHHAALALEGALAAGWDTLDRYSAADRQLVEEALEELIAAHHRRGRLAEGPLLDGALLDGAP